MIPQTQIDEIIERNDIVSVVSEYVKLTRKGGNDWGLCPFHNEKTPSFSVNENKQTKASATESVIFKIFFIKPSCFARKKYRVFEFM